MKDKDMKKQNRKDIRKNTIMRSIEDETQCYNNRTEENNLK